QVAGGLAARRAGADAQLGDLLQGTDPGEPRGEPLALDERAERRLRGVADLVGQRAVARGGLPRAVLDGVGGGEQHGAGDLLDVPPGDLAVAVAGEDDLALLGHLEAARDRARRLRQDRPVGGAAAAAEGTAPAVEQ